ncbi:MAG: MAPEG family protein [Myxococcota bacterium]|nr:MAPEG family protein [Myxococcota bacterium]
MPTILPLYAGILGLMSIVLASLAGRLRGSTKISVGDGGDSELLVAMRRHANFIEYVPLALVLIALVEMSGAPALAIHLLGGGLVVSRLCHAIGLNADTIQSAARIVGAAGTMLVTLVASVWAIVSFV